MLISIARSRTLCLAALLMAALLASAGCGDDDGPGDDAGANNNNSQASSCGNGQVEGVEECDQGEANSDSLPDACRTDCTAARCGDGVTDTGEGCDDGRGNNDVSSDACRTDCTPPRCGDGVVDVGLGESCEDGNTVSDDGCSSGCQVEYCGNGIVEAGEACDDGNVVGGDGCSPDCRSDESCGNGIQDSLAGEECDCGDAAGPGPLPPGCNQPNSDDPGATCDQSCLLHGCGDGVIVLPEECEGADLGGRACQDLGFYMGALACTPYCRFDTSLCSGRCGDGVVNGLEQCDGAPPATATCLDYGYDTGELGCTQVCTPDFSKCRYIGWTPQSAPDTTYQGVWVAPTGRAFAVGAFGRIITWDGAAWSPMVSGTMQHLMAVFGRAANDVWAVGDAGTILHFDGLAWSPVTSGTAEVLWAVWVSEDGTVFAAGEAGITLVGQGGAFVQHPSGTTEHLSGLWGISSSEVFAAGYGGKTLRWNGSSWSSLINLTGEDLYGIWGFATTDILVTSQTGNISRYNGLTWVPDANSTKTLFSLWGSAADDVFAVGAEGACLYHDGWTWASYPVPSTDMLYSVHGLRGNLVMAAGGGEHGGRIWHFDGMAWRPAESPTKNTLRAAWAAPDGTAFAVGDDSTILRFDGSAWSEASIPVSGRHLRAIWGSSDDNVWAVGTQGTCLRYNGIAWEEVILNTSEDLYAVGGTAQNNVFVAGGNGLVMRFDGFSWTTLSPPGPPYYEYRSIVVRGQADVLLGGGPAGELTHWDGSAFSSYQYPGMGFGAYMHGEPSGLLWVADATGDMFHFDGLHWTRHSYGHLGGLNGLCGARARHRFAVAGGGAILWNERGDSWLPLRSGTLKALLGCFADHRQAIFVGQDGALLHLKDWQSPLAAAETRCDDLVDDDGDGLADCRDPDCASSPPCELPEASCTDGFDNDGNGLTDCADPACDGVGSCELPETSCSDGLDNDGNGLTDCADPACDGVGSCELPETSCTDGLDNDRDGRADCLDPDCFCSPGCDPCPGAAAISCGQVVSGSTLDPALIDRIPTYGCLAGAPSGYGSPSAESGPEAAYLLTTGPASQVISITLTDALADLDLFVLPLSASGPPYVCDPSQCVAASATNTLPDELAYFTSEPNTSYMIVVDGFQGAQSPFTLEVHCQ